MNDDIELPPLPNRALRPGAGDDAMTDYARAAVIADRARRVSAEPVVWLEAQPGATLREAVEGMYVSTLWHRGGDRPTKINPANELWPLYAAPPPAPPADALVEALAGEKA